MKKIIETQFNEIRKKTSDLKEMLNKYTSRRVLKTWIEDFVDEDNGKVTSIERNEILFERGIFIDQEVLAQINFFMQAGDIKEVEVSNQCRAAFQVKNTYMHPYIAQVVISGRKVKKIKFLFHATSIPKSLELLKDYIELNYRDGFYITMLKEFDSCIILTDNLKKYKSDLPFDQWEDVDVDVDNDTDEEATELKKFFQLDITIRYDNDTSYTQTFVVHSFNVDRCMMLINKYLNEKEKERESAAIINGSTYTYVDFHTMIEEAKPISIGCYIPLEFSEAYRDRDND